MAGSRHTLKLRRSRLIGVERKEKRIMKILLIEDDIEISEMLCSYLIAENFEVSVLLMAKRHVRLSILVLIVSSYWI